MSKGIRLLFFIIFIGLLWYYVTLIKKYHAESNKGLGKIPPSIVDGSDCFDDWSKEGLLSRDREKPKLLIKKITPLKIVLIMVVKFH